MNHLAQLGRMSETLDQKGFRILGIGGADRVGALEIAQALSSQITILIDPDRRISRLFGYSKVAAILQRSGTAIVSKDGLIRYIHRVSNPRSSLKPSHLLEAVNAI